MTETNAEWLRLIREDRKNKSRFDYELPDEDIDFLIQQAERGRDSEVENHGHRYHVSKVKKENKRLREALKFYATKANYIRDSQGESCADDDDGYRARQALEQSK